MGSSDTLTINSGVDQITGTAADTITTNGMQLNSVIQLAGNNNMAFIGSDSSLNLLLNQAQTGNQIMVQADVDNTYSGVVDISYFNQSDLLTLNGLTGGITHTDMTSYASVLANITAGSNSDTLHLGGGGAIVFSAITGFTAGEFAFGTHTGPLG